MIVSTLNRLVSTAVDQANNSPVANISPSASTAATMPTALAFEATSSLKDRLKRGWDLQRVDPRQAILRPADQIGIGGAARERQTLWNVITDGPAVGRGHLGYDHVMPFNRSDYLGGVGESVITPDRTRAPLFVKGAGDVNEVSLNDINQAGLGDCYLMATLGAVAMQDPQAIKNMIRENEDGTFTVTFKERIYGTNPPEYSDKPITVSPDFPGFLDGWGHAQAADANGKGQKEIWPLVIEKAYAELRGGYDVLDKGARPVDMMEAITGRPAKVEPDRDDFSNAGVGSPIGLYNVVNKTFGDLADDLRKGKAVVFSTPAERKDANGMVIPNEPLPFDLVHSHSYVVESAYQDAQGKQWLKLYNPWGNTQPAPVPYDAIYKGSAFSITVS